jgi:hypothetical protein
MCDVAAKDAEEFLIRFDCELNSATAPGFDSCDAAAGGRVGSVVSRIVHELERLLDFVDAAEALEKLRVDRWQRVQSMDEDRAVGDPVRDSESDVVDSNPTFDPGRPETNKGIAARRAFDCATEGQDRRPVDVSFDATSINGKKDRVARKRVNGGEVEVHRPASRNFDVAQADLTGHLGGPAGLFQKHRIDGDFDRRAVVLADATKWTGYHVGGRNDLRDRRLASL